MPTVSVVIPTYNRAHFIGRALRSVLAQTFRDFEILVVDDGSDDATAEIVAALESPRVTLLRHPVNRGAQAARNTGIRAATGEFVAFLDSDDTWAPAKLERQLAVFAAAGPGVGVVHAPCETRKDEASPPRPFPVPPLRGAVYRDLLAAPGPVFHMILTRRLHLERIGLLDETLPAYQEWDTAIRLARHYEFAWVPEILGTYYLHGGEAISRSWAREAEGYLRVVTAHRDEMFAQCGRKALGRHYAAVAKHYAFGDLMPQARHWYRRALGVHPLSARALAGYLSTPLGGRRLLRLRAAFRALRPRVPPART